MGNDINSTLSPFADPYILPLCTDDFKEWHMKVLRRLNKHPVNKPFSGIMTLEVDIPKFIPILQDLQLIKLASFKDALNLTKVDILKQILRENNLKVSGNKHELVDRLLNNLDEATIRNSECYTDFYMLTDYGHQIVKDSYERFQQEHVKFFAAAISLILQYDFNAAYRMICKRNAEKPVPPGMNCDWKGWYFRGIPDSTYSVYENILTAAAVKNIAATAIYQDMSGESSHSVTTLYRLSYGEELNDEKSLYRRIAIEKNFSSDVSSDIDEYMFLAIFDLRTCPTCRNLDGKIFKVTDRKIGVNCPPMHSGCRCTTIDIIGREYIKKMTRRALDPSTGKPVTIPLSMNYQQWYDKYVEKKNI